MRTAQVVRVHGMKGVESVSGENPVVKWGAFKKALLKANMAFHDMSVLNSRPKILGLLMYAQTSCIVCSLPCTCGSCNLEQKRGKPYAP